MPIRDAVLTMAYFAERDGLLESARLLYAVGGMMPARPDEDADDEIDDDIDGLTDYEVTEGEFYRVIDHYWDKGVATLNKTGLGIGGR